MKNNIISKIINDLETTKRYVEFNEKGKTYQLLGCDIEKLNNCMKAIYCEGLIMINDSLKSKDKIQVVEQIMNEIYINNIDKIYIDSEWNLLHI